MDTHFITSLAEHIKETYDLKKEELTIVFPNKRAAFYLRSKFQEVFHEEIWLPQMLSIEEAMTQWSGKQLIDTVDMLFELISINSEVFGKSDNIGFFGSMATQMAKDFDEIDQYNVDANYLFSYVYQTQKIGEWNFDHNATPKEEMHLAFFRDLEQYYDKLRERLDQQHKGYYGMITRYLASLDESQLIERTNHRKIVFAGFNALTPTEQTIIDKLYRNGCAEVVWDFDRFYVEDKKNEAGRFARSYITRAWKPTKFSDSLLTKPKEIHIVEAKGNGIQTKALQSLLQVKDEANTAIVLADEDLLVPVLNSIPNAARYSQLKVSMGYPLRQTSLHHFILAFFTLHSKGRKVENKGWYVWPILRILDLELIQVIFNSKELEELSAYRAFVAKKQAFIFNTKEFEGYCSRPNLMKFMELLLCHNAEPPTGLLNALVALLAFIANQVQTTNPKNTAIFLLNQVSEAGKAINRLNNIVIRYQHYVDKIEDLEMLFRLVSTNTSVKLNSSSNDGLQIMGLLETRNLDFDTFYMVGVNEGILPANNSSNSFIPYFIRKECGLPDEQDKQAVYAYHFYRLLQGAQKAYFIYNSNGASNGGEPSRFLLQIKHELAKSNPDIKLFHEVFSAPIISNLQPERIVINKSDELMETLMQKIQTTNLHNALAPTSISTFIKCPLLFCFRYLMNIKDSSADENTPANVIGSVIHDTFRRLYEKHCKVVITPQLFSSVIKPSLDDCYNQAVFKECVHGLPNVGYNYLDRLTIDKMLNNFIAFEEGDVANHQLSIIALEYILHTTIEVNGVPCVIAGTADRIDRHDGMVRIIDYKTGLIQENNVTVPQNVNSVADIPEKALQLLIYKYLYVKEHNADPSTVSASLYGLRQRQICLDLKVEYEPLNQAFVETMEGLLREVLASMMDRSLPFEQPDGTNDRPCRYCDFNGICVSTLAGARLEDGH